MPDALSPTIPPLEPDEIHVWAVSPLATDAEAEQLVAALSSHEQHRAARMRQPDLRRAFVVGRARVRQILSAYIGHPPHELDVVARVDDKPVLAGAPPWFDFSFSRCDRLHACAVGHGRRLGVDVETIGDGHDASGIAATFFSSEDAAWISAQAVASRAAAFASIWTKKEAVVKAIGSGLKMPLRAVRVPYEDAGPVAWADPASPPGRPWFVRAFTPAPGVAGAVAAEGRWRLTLLQWPPAPLP
ncbi:MAG: 4'-phosphopantetheinyl transferase superfamily protein [Vicinamibacterales bacterium]